MKQLNSVLCLLIISTVIISCDCQLKQGYLYVDIYDSEKACNGTTLLTEVYDPQKPRVIEVDMQGNIVWEYILPDNLKQYTQPGFDAELLSNGHILIVLPRKGIREIDRSGNILWKHDDEKISHDADRLSNGDTIYVFGGGDKKGDPQVKEVDSNGDLVWSWYAKEEFDVDPYADIDDQGWTHINAVTRLQNGNTLASLRNFGLTVIIGTDGSVLRTYDWTYISGATNPDPHEPEVESEGALLIALQNDSPYQGVEIDMTSEEIVWSYSRDGLRTTRDCDRLPNGNTLLVGVLREEDEAVIFEVTSGKEIVWQLRLNNAPVGKNPGWFYKAQRICQ
jgi:hypothetical protein